MEWPLWLAFWVSDLLSPLLGGETAAWIGFFWGPMAIALLVQLGLLRLTRDRWRPLRFAGLSLPVPPIVTAFYFCRRRNGWWGVGALFCLIIALALLIGWGGAWLVSPHSRRKEKDEN